MKATLLLCLATLAFAAGSQRALAMAGDLDKPSLALPESAGPPGRKSVMEALTERPADFLGGRFINATTALGCGGSTDSLNRFLAGLAACQA